MLMYHMLKPCQCYMIVLYRGFLNDTDKLTFCTDMRSRKVDEIAHGSRTQVCWYFTDSREQFRLDGALQVVGAECTDTVLNQVCTDPGVLGLPLRKQSTKPCS